MREQARAQELWERQDWDNSFKNACRQAHVKTYAKDYVSAVNCVSALQQEKQAQAAKDEAEAKRKDRKTGYSGRSGQVLSGGKMVSY
jgi:hypothetical protein